MAILVPTSVSFQLQLGSSGGGAGAGVNKNVLMTFGLVGKYMFDAIRTVPTSAATIDFGPISGAPRKILIMNLDDTNYLEYGGDSGLTVFKERILPGDFGLLSPTSATMYWKANVATVDVVIVAINA